MSKSDWLLLGFNALFLVWMFLGFASTDLDTLMVGALMGMLVSVANGTAIVLRSRKREAALPSPDLIELEDDMNVHRVLEIDQRLEALERAETRRLRTLADDGVLTAPAAPLLEVTDEAASLRQRA